MINKDDVMQFLMVSAIVIALCAIAAKAYNVL